jgi:monoamine oxidase
MNPPVLVVGGGLAGLVAAHRLHQADIGFVLLEARTRLGGGS